MSKPEVLFLNEPPYWIHNMPLVHKYNLYNNTPSYAIANEASNVCYSPLIQTDIFAVLKNVTNLNLSIFYCLNNDKRIRHKFFNLVLSFRCCNRTIRFTNKTVSHYFVLFYKLSHKYCTHLGLHMSTNAVKETRYIQYGPLLLFQ
jgi:uncharacterized surface anchored protein